RSAPALEGASGNVAQRGGLAGPVGEGERSGAPVSCRPPATSSSCVESAATFRPPVTAQSSSLLGDAPRSTQTALGLPLRADRWANNLPPSATWTPAPLLSTTRQSFRTAHDSRG